MVRKAIVRLSKISLPTWLLVTLIIMFVLRIPSFFEPFSYGDEMIYLTLGNAIRKGVILYKDIHDNKPPLLYLLATLAGNVFWFRAILATWVSITIVIFWKLVTKLFNGQGRIIKTSTIFFAILATIPLFEGQTSNSEIFMLGLTTLALLIVINKKSAKTIFISGFLFGLATLFKIPAAFDAPVLILYLLFGIKAVSVNKIKTFILLTIVFAIGFLIPILATIVWFAALGALPDYIKAAFGQNVGYLSSWRGSAVQQTFFEKNGPLIIRALVVAVGILISCFAYAKRKISSGMFIATIWLMTSLFAATLSERPYPHYVIQEIAAISILVGILIGQKTKEQVYPLIPLTLAIFALVYFKFWQYSSNGYYGRFTNYARAVSTREQYFSQFGEMINTDYKVALYIKEHTNPDQKIFVWGDSAVIYALSQRLPAIKYVADYHVSDFSSQEEVITKLISSPPKYMVVLPKSQTFTKLTQMLQQNYILTYDVNGATVWKKLLRSTF